MIAYASCGLNAPSGDGRLTAWGGGLGSGDVGFGLEVAAVKEQLDALLNVGYAATCGLLFQCGRFYAGIARKFVDGEDCFSEE